MAETAALAHVNGLRGVRRSPASHLAPAFDNGSVPGIVELHEIPFQTMVGIRVDPASEGGKRVAAVTGGLPARCGEVGSGDVGSGDVGGGSSRNSASRNGASRNGASRNGAVAGSDSRMGGGVTVLWLSPFEFLVVAPEGAHDSLGGDLVRALTEALADGEGQVVDLSANRTVFELSGSRAQAVLEKGCALDLHPRSFAAGTALATEIGHIPTMLLKTGEETFRVFPRASLADYLGRWILDGMREFASPEVP
ncbi:sarcosine oxidase subunit gamma [Pseudarthrobacter sp. N5]|uniref:sarcosine oxidase subunit gamma n=1 Tax=Pseudarthrobacter sp. N5 TaxID=3418416 RepID=UPI003CF57299